MRGSVLRLHAMSMRFGSALCLLCMWCQTWERESVEGAEGRRGGEEDGGPGMPRWGAQGAL